MTSKLNAAHTTTPAAHPSATWDSKPLDLRAYLERIGYDGPLTPDLQTLTALQHAHLEAIPFESLDPVLGRPVRLDIDTLQDKLVKHRRGGYCHEHNILFASVLDRLGFQVTGRSARMLMGQDEREIGAVGHTVLSVIVEGTDWHVDVGIGDAGPRGPIPLQEGVEIDTGPWRYRLDRTEHTHWLLRFQRPNGWFNLIQFTEEPFYRADFVDHNFLASHSPESPFTRHIVVSHNGDQVRHSLQDLTLTTRRPGEIPQELKITAEEIPRTLRSVFGLMLTVEHENALVDRVRTSAGIPWPELSPTAREI